ncbi:MAG: hypothetical protein IJ600_03725 [Lachnospiraceae bacterium]|nr:hypothetical protein [Lachnospiraceae bacterium]
MDSYMEYLVKKEVTGKDKAVRVLCIAVIALVALAGVFVLQIFIVVALILALIYRYFIYPLTDLEYEYLYCDKQITVSKIMAREKRKDVAVYDLEKIELLVPANSYRLADYNKRDLNVVDYWSLDPAEDHIPYALIYEGKSKILLDLPADFVKIVQNNAPRKVFFD